MNTSDSKLPEGRTGTDEYPRRRPYCPPAIEQESEIEAVTLGSPIIKANPRNPNCRP